MPNTDTSLIQEKLLLRINEKMDRLTSLRPIPADAVKKLYEEMKLLHTYHSNAIEDNTLTLLETKLVLEEGITIGGKSLREHIEARFKMKDIPEKGAIIQRAVSSSNKFHYKKF